MTSTSPRAQNVGRSPVFSPAGLNPSMVFDVPATWYSRVYAVNLTPYAQNLPCGSDHLSLSAISYYLLPGPGPTYPYSAYFDPYSPYFHLLAGAYIVAPVGGKRVPLEVLGALSVNEIVALLERFRDPKPTASVGEVILTPTGTDRWYLEFTGNRSHLCVGSHMPQKGVPVLFAVPNKPVVGTKHWSDLIDDYAEADEVLAFGDASYHNDYLIWNWWMGIRFVDKMGQVHDSRGHPHEFEEAKQIATSARIIDRGIGIVPPHAH
jgi:hypothetical protein